jgi:hypothetical protein
VGAIPSNSPTLPGEAGPVPGRGPRSVGLTPLIVASVDRTQPAQVQAIANIEAAKKACLISVT